MTYLRLPARRVTIVMAAAIAAVVVVAKELPPSVEARAQADAGLARHVLNRVTFGVRQMDVDAIRAIGIERYLDRQLHPERIDDSALEERLGRFDTLTMSTGALAEEYFLPAIQARRAEDRRARQDATAPQPSPNRPDSGSAQTPMARSPERRMAAMQQQRVMNELMQAKLLRAIYSERQLQEVLTDFWFNHFNVFAGKGQVRQYLTSYERDTIRPHVFGRFRDLLGAVAHSPAMLLYLDNWQSGGPGTRAGGGRSLGSQRQTRPETRRTRGLNENYARELLELHTLGTGGGYAQSDVVALARVFTGWTIDRPLQGGQFVFRAGMHDTGTKTLLGVAIEPAGEREGERALDLLARHPATSRHLAFKLAQRFVADEPPASLVERAAQRFRDTDGDLRHVVRVILTSPEFLDPVYHRSKIRTPLEFVTASIRATGAKVQSAQPLVITMRNLGMPLYGCQPPTGYSTTAGAWVNTGALLNRMNAALAFTSGGRTAPVSLRGDGNRQDERRAMAQGRRSLMANDPIQLDVPGLAPDTSDATRLRLIGSLLGTEVSDATKLTLARATDPAALIALVLGSPEFQRH